jgi:hypothetical protein
MTSKHGPGTQSLRLCLARAFADKLQLCSASSMRFPACPNIASSPHSSIPVVAQTTAAPPSGCAESFCANSTTSG